MAEQDFSKKEKNYYIDIPQKSEAFFLKGSNSYDWGMKNRLARIFKPAVRQDRDAGLRSRVFPGPHRPGSSGSISRSSRSSPRPMR